MNASAKQKADKSASPKGYQAVLIRISEARRECGNGVRMLPVVRYERKLWFFDERLKQLRNVRNPHDFIDLNDFEVEYFRQEVV
jgi:hypothetical protein